MSAPEEMTLKVIAHIHTAFPTKFGIPRQSGLVDSLRGEVIFTPEYRNADAVRGLEDFSHIWLVWQFSGAVRDSWSPTVRPPRLGGNTRMGVFATRSPFRPNPLGLSSVQLEAIEHRPDVGPVLIVRGADLMDGTPIYDIKPYIPYADCRPEASGGFTGSGGGATLAVDFPPELLELAEKHGRTLLRTDRKTVDATSEIIDYLNKKLAPQITRHGVLMNINGQGVLILGESGIGKSETAIELLKRGHRLVADDAVEIRRISTSLYGTAPELIRHYIEIRGVGVIDVQQLFGMGAVQFDTEIDLVVQLEQWKDGKFYDRLGLGEETYEILGVKLPYMIVPVRPGRNLAGIVEIATMKNRQMKYGYNPARDFVTRLDQHYDALNEANRRKNQ